MSGEEAEARQKRVECRHRTGQMFASVEDLQWLYFDLARQGGLEDSCHADELERLIRESVWASLWEEHELDLFS